MRIAVVVVAVLGMGCAGSEVGGSGAPLCAPAKGMYAVSYASVDGAPVRLAGVLHLDPAAAPFGCSGTWQPTADGCDVEADYTCFVDARSDVRMTGALTVASDVLEGRLELCTLPRAEHSSCATYDVTMDPLPLLPVR